MRLTPPEIALVAAVLVLSIRVLISYGDRRSEDQRYMDALARRDRRTP